MTLNTNNSFICTRHIDGAWHVVVSAAETEHIFRDGFRNHDDAFTHADEIEALLAQGLDVNPTFWASQPLS